MDRQAKADRRPIGLPLLLSVIGVAVTIALPIWAGSPDLQPAFLSDVVGPLPVMTWLVMLVMAALVVLAVVCASTIKSDD